MRPEASLKWPLFVGVAGFTSCVVVIFFLVVILYCQDSYAESAPVQNITSSARAFQSIIEAGPGLPVRLKIPKIKVDAKIEYVGLTPKGEMGVPKIPRNAAWFELGPRPGGVGSAAIAGHINWWTGAASVFVNLNKLKIGDKVVVQDDKGKEIVFIVRKIRAYGSKENALDVFYSNDNKSHLNLITCFGEWNKKIKQYSKRLVVFTDREILK